MVGLPSSIQDLEPTACRVLQHIGVGITGEGIRACHCLNKQSNRTMDKLTRMKDCDQVMQKKSELRKLKPSELVLPNGKKQGQKLCPCYKVLWSQCKKLWNKKGIFFFHC